MLDMVPEGDSHDESRRLLTLPTLLGELHRLRVRIDANYSDTRILHSRLTRSLPVLTDANKMRTDMKFITSSNSVIKDIDQVLGDLVREISQVRKIIKSDV